MAKQLNMLTAGQVITTALHTEMQQSYLEYAMSVIVGRALPDVRDGLKPVHRRILYAMHELGLTPDRPYRKCARVVGDVLGKYHPHGDQAVYDALVRMVQEFSSRYPLLAGHGNFGSVDDDPPAAMRYTETRLAPIGNEAILSDIGESTVNFTGNFDNSQQEPTVLPAELPFLLLNGSSGIAVGMATNIPPHNLGEVVDGLIALIDNPNLPDEKLWELIPGPDFPTGGEIIDRQGIRDAYLTGRGSIPVRGVAQIEEIQPGRGRHRRPVIIVTELPYQVNKAGWIEKVAELVTHGKLEGIADIRDESDRDGIRVVIELKRESNPQKLLAALYKQTALQSNFGAILLALYHGQPRQMPLREVLQHFLDFREETLTRRHQHEFDKAETRCHVLEGLLVALDRLDDVIEILRHAPDGSTAKLALQEELELSDRQADAILAMPMRRLTGMEQTNLRDEYEQLSARMAELENLLHDRRELLKVLKKDLRAQKKKFGDARRTKILSAPSPLPVMSQPLSEAPASITKAPKPAKSAKPTGVRPRVAESVSSQAEQTVTGSTQETLNLTPSPGQPLRLEAWVEDDEDVIVEVTHRGYVRRLPVKTFQTKRSSNGRDQNNHLEAIEDFPVRIYQGTIGQTLVALTRQGKAYPVPLRSIPPAAKTAKGLPLVSLLPPAVQTDPDAIADVFLMPEHPTNMDLLLVSQQGRVKRLALSDFADLTNRGLTALKLKDDDQIAYVTLTRSGEHLILATSNGRLVHWVVGEDQVPIASRSAQGQPLLRLGKKERLVGIAALPSSGEVLLLTEKGYTKRMLVNQIKRCNVGDLGIQGFLFTTKADTLAGLVAVQADQAVKVMTSQGQMACLGLDSVPVEDREGKGDRILKLSNDEKVLVVIAIKFPSAEGLLSEED